MTEAAMENMPNEKSEQNTTGDAIFRALLSPLRSCEKVQSRYLKPSMTSCHDYCKYGKKHDNEVASVDLRTFLKKKRREQNQVATPNGEEKKSITISKPKIKVEPNKKSITPSAKTLPKSQESKQNEVESPTLHDEKRRKVIKRRTWVRPESSQELNVINSTNLLSSDVEADTSVDSCVAKEITISTLGEPTSTGAPTAFNSIDLSPASAGDILGDTVESALSEHISSLALAKTKRRAPSVRKVQTIINQNAPLPPKRGDVAVRCAIVLKTRTPLLRSISHLKSSRSLITRRNLEKKTTKKFGVVASKPVNTLKTTSAPLLRSISTRRNLENLRSTNTSETKILEPSQGIIAERKVPPPPPPPPPPTTVSSLNPGKSRNVKRSNSVKTLDHKTDDAKSVINEGISREGNSRGARRTWTVHPQNNTPAPYKLKFKQGKVLDLRCDSIGARRLWFRLGQTSTENQNSDGFARKRSFRKKEVDASESKVTDSEPRAVVLKHQETEEKKKDGQALFNYVIEETASKLVEARKSKVKALVGAFETVISLQESKPAAVVLTV